MASCDRGSWTCGHSTHVLISTGTSSEFWAAASVPSSGGCLRCTRLPDAPYGAYALRRVELRNPPSGMHTNWCTWLLDVPTGMRAADTTTTTSDDIDAEPADLGNGTPPTGASGS